MKYNNPLTSEQQKLIEDNLVLINYALAKIPLFLFDSREDAFQVGAIGLIKAAHSFDPQRNTRFATYAMPCIVNELLMTVRQINRTMPQGKTCSLDAPIGDLNGEVISLAELLPSEKPGPEDHLIAREALGTVTDALNMIPENATLVRLTLAHTTQKDIAMALGCTQSAVSRKLQRLRIQLRQAVL